MVSLNRPPGEKPSPPELPEGILYNTLVLYAMTKLAGYQVKFGQMDKFYTAIPVVLIGKPSTCSEILRKNLTSDSDSLSLAFSQPHPRPLTEPRRQVPFRDDFSVYWY